jgi:hypothetical protein
MNRDVLNHILFEIDERFIELQQFATWHFKLKDFNDDWEVFKQKETYRWTINDLISYICINIYNYFKFIFSFIYFYNIILTFFLKYIIILKS